MAAKPLRLTLDAAFKIYFKESLRLQRSLLEDFLPLPKGSKIEKIDLLNAEEHSSEEGGKTFILDLKIRIQRNENGELKQNTINVEMQSIEKTHFIDRILAYSARIYSNQVKKGKGYGTLRPVYSLVFTAFDLKPFKELPNYCHEVELLRRHPPHIPLAEGRGMQYIFIELSKFTKGLSEVLDQKEAWCYLLKNSDAIGEKEGKELAKRGKDMGEAVKRLWDLSQDELVQERLEAIERQRNDRIAELAFATEQGTEAGVERYII